MARAACISPCIRRAFNPPLAAGLYADVHCGYNIAAAAGASSSIQDMATA